MTRGCKVTQAADEFRSQLEVQGMPDEYDVAGEYWRIVGRVRHEFTKYDALLKALPACPLYCSTAVKNGDVEGQRCTNYDIARTILQIEARVLAVRLVYAWHARRKSALPPLTDRTTVKTPALTNPPTAARATGEPDRRQTR